MYPTKLQPAVKNYLWGGKRLAQEFNIASKDPSIAEAWMLSCHSNGESRILNGPLSGQTLGEVLFGEAETALGTSASLAGYFPFLIKLIDAGKDLSVQVHPDDAYAQAHEGGFGKTEVWYVLDAAEGASVRYGFTRAVTKEEIRQRIASQTLDEVLRKIPVRRGDVIFVPPGTVHAIGAGILIAEVQQNSDATYRLFDYGRTDQSGKLRQLHIEKALDVAILEPAPDLKPVEMQDREGYEISLLALCAAFTSELARIRSFAEFHVGTYSMVSAVVTGGAGRILFANRSFGSDGEMEIRKGTSVFLPAGTGNFRIEGKCEVLLTARGRIAT